jgi:hypothetical protein
MIWVTVIVAVMVIGVVIYGIDTLNKFKDDIRTIRSRTGKMVKLLDAVLSASGDDAARLVADARHSMAGSDEGDDNAVLPDDGNNKREKKAKEVAATKESMEVDEDIVTRILNKVQSIAQGQDD